MTIIRDQYFDGERPLYESRGLRLERVRIGEGESGLKESRQIEAVDCEFEGKYVIWECEDVECRNCHFAESDRAPLWYNRNIRLYDCLIDAPKAFREVDGLTLERIRMTNGEEAFCHCRDGKITDLQLNGKYVFQYAKNIEIHNAVLDSKDAFWESENCTVYDSTIRGEYLGWYAKNLRLVRCRISGTQPLCYCQNLIMEDCVLAPDADRAYEKSTFATQM